MAETKDFRLGHRERVRGRFVREGLAPFVDYEVLELLLFFVIQRRDTKGMAHALIHRFSSLGAVLRAEVKELCEISGIGERTAVFLRALLPFAQLALENRGAADDTVSVDERLKAHFVEYFKRKTEGGKVAVAYLDNRGVVLDTSLLPTDRFTEASVSVKQILSLAFAHGAASVSLAYQVNSAIPFPDMDAFSLTHALAKELMGTGLSLCDNYLVAREKVISVVDMMNGVPHHGRERPTASALPVKNDHEALRDMLALFMSKERAEAHATELEGKPLRSLFLMPYKKLMDEYPSQSTVIYFLQVLGDLLSYERKERLQLKPPVLKTADEMGEMFRSVLCGKRLEAFCLACFDRDMRMIRLKIFSEGTVTAATVPSRALLEETAESGAFAVALAHNHPLGTVEPSNVDGEVTSQFFKTFRAIGVSFLEHFVVNETEYKPIAREYLRVQTDAQETFYE